MLSAYLGKNVVLPFRKTRTNIDSAIGGFTFFAQYWGQKVVLSYAPVTTDEALQKKIRQAIRRVQKLMPFIPRCILVRDNNLKTVVAVSSYGAQKCTTKVYLYTDPCPAYQIDKTSIDYLFDHFDELSSVESDLVVAMTGEKFFCMNEATDRVDVPKTWASFNCVFGPQDHDNDRCHLVIMSAKEIPKMTRMTWVDKTISLEYSSCDVLVHAANTIARHLVSCTHNFDEIYALANDKSQNVAPVGKMPSLHQSRESSCPIGRIFDRYAMYCIKGQVLEHKVELQGINISGNISSGPEGPAIGAMKRFQKNHPNLPEDKLRALREDAFFICKTNKELCDLKERKKTLADAWNNGGCRERIKMDQANIKRREAELKDQQTKPRERLKESGISEEDIKTLGKAVGPLEMLTMEYLARHHGHYETVQHVSKSAGVIRRLKR